MRQARILTTETGKDFLVYTTAYFDYDIDTGTLTGRTEDDQLSFVYVLSPEEAVIIQEVLPEDRIDFNADIVVE